MTHTSVDVYLVIDTFLLLLIGIGPKIALVPFVEITAPLDGSTKALIVRKMLTTAAVVALILLVDEQKSRPGSHNVPGCQSGRDRADVPVERDRHHVVEAAVGGQCAAVYLSAEDVDP